MERECGEGKMEKKLRRRSFLSGNYCKRASPSTPSPTWRLGFSQPSPSRGGAFSTAVKTKEFLMNSEVSVRKLCADLWESEQFRPPIELRRCQRRDSDVESPCRSPFLDHQPPSRDSLRKQITAKLKSTNDHRNGDRLQPIRTSNSDNNSLEVMVHKPAFSTSSSMAIGLSSSTKILNRIWSLEEQNATNVSLVKALKIELDECRAEIKEVQQQDDLKDRFRSIKMELEDEKEVRKKSESRHRKLAQELCEANHCLNKALKDLEKERNQRIIVENLCDEFANSVKDYEDKVRRVENKSPVSDKVIVQIAEVWNDQRLQMKQEEDHFLSSKLGFDIEKFLRTKEKGSYLREKSEDSGYLDNRVCLKELEKRTRRDNKLKTKIHPEKSRTFSKFLEEARLESQRLRSSKPKSSSSQV